MVQKYLDKLNKKLQAGNASERTYYPVLENFLDEYSKKTDKKITVTIEPKNTNVGIPDFKITSGNKLFGYIEAKDIDKDLDKIDLEQVKRYLADYPKVILTNFIEFRLYENNELVQKVEISQPITVKLKTLVLQKEAEFEALLERFFASTIPQIHTSRKLSELLAHKTHVLKGLILEEINLKDNITTQTEELLDVFKKTLIHNITPEEFADMYAQTITFGLFVARVKNPDDDFTRERAYRYIPKTIPLLRRLFSIVSGQDLPQHLEWQVDEIAEILANTNIQKIKDDFFSEGEKRDPIIHFYETFLSKYDAKLREKRGVYYTPQPVVSYIISSIDRILKKNFNKPDGFADKDVKVLDPAAGTLTFPVEAISLAKENYVKKYGDGGWKSLVKEHILNDFYAFEILMAPYAIGHLKISLLLEELGYKFTDNDKFNLYLTNTLEMEKVKAAPMLLAHEISEESEEAYKVKNSTPIMVVMGNPPYSGQSENKGKWILNLINDYKQIDGESLGERNPKWIQDDYVKFFRFAQWKIEKTGQGVVGFITNHAWLDNPTFRGMRHSLLKTFDEIYILNLHGSTLRKLVGDDENVFDIQTGVAITLLIKNPDIKTKKVFYSEKLGEREEKYKWLEKNDLFKTDWKELIPKDPYWFFVPKDETGFEKYQTFAKITDIFPVNSVGIVTGRDEFVTDSDKKVLEQRIRILRDKSNSDDFIRQSYGLKDKPASNWYLSKARKAVQEDKDWENYFEQIEYRPFDKRWIYNHPALVERSRDNVMANLKKKNLALIVNRTIKMDSINHMLVSDCANDLHILETANASAYTFPLYIYSVRDQQTIFSGQEKLEFKGAQHTLRTNKDKEANIDPALFEKLIEAYNDKITPEEFFSYIYAVLYSNEYRKKYQEFLKVDFPKIPFTKDIKLFLKLSDWGQRLIGLHLLKSVPADSRYRTKFEGQGEGLIEKIELRINEVWINNEQKFTPVPEEAWNYYIGGYQVLSKWLKDKKGRRLSVDESKKYSQIVTAIKSTIEIQKEIDKLYPRIEKDLMRS